MHSRRRDFLKELSAIGMLPAVMVSPEIGRAMGALDQESAKQINPDIDTNAYGFWRDFLSRDAEPVVPSADGPRRGNHSGADDAQPVFLHYGPDGFHHAAELDPSQLVSSGDVMVSVNTSTVKVATADQQTFDHLQNAQIRVDVAQRAGVLPMLEAMAYTVVAGMRSIQSESQGKSNSKAAKPAASNVQNISVRDDASWQKMQNIPLPAGEGRWALSLEAQKQDSLFCRVLQHIVKEAGLFVPLLGFPGIAMSALNSFNNLYGVLHSGTVPIIRGNPVRVMATQEAVQSTGAPGAVTGIMLHRGTYILIPAKQCPPIEQLNKNFSVIQGHIVPPKTPSQDLDAAAADTLKEVTYVTFDVQVRPLNLLTGVTKKA